MTPHLNKHSTTDLKPEILSSVLTGNRISRDGRNERGITHVHRKDDIFRQKLLNHSGIGEGDYVTQSHTAEPHSCLLSFWLRMLVFVDPLDLV